MVTFLECSVGLRSLEVLGTKLMFVFDILYSQFSNFFQVVNIMKPSCQNSMGRVILVCNLKWAQLFLNFEILEPPNMVDYVVVALWVNFLLFKSCLLLFLYKCELIALCRNAKCEIFLVFIHYIIICYN